MISMKINADRHMVSVSVGALKAQSSVVHLVLCKGASSTVQLCKMKNLVQRMVGGNREIKGS